MTVNQFIEKYKIESSSVRVNSRPDELSDWGKDSRHWEVTLTYLDEYTRKNLSIYFTQGSAHTKRPTAEDVLVSVLMDVQGIEDQNFLDWAGNMGYSDDSIKALKIYEACMKEQKDIKEWLGQEKYNEFLECEE